MIELLVVVAVIAILAALLLPVLSRAKGSASRAICASNLRQLRVAFGIYLADNYSKLPPRNLPTGEWPTQLYPNYANVGLLMCPADPVVATAAAPANAAPDAALRSYLMNGFQDAVFQALGGGPPQNGAPPPALVEGVIAHPSDTLLFGEKTSASTNFCVVLELNAASYLPSLEEGRHGGTPARTPNKSGMSNYAFGDGSVRTVRWGECTCPINLWAVTDFGRTAFGVCQPH